MRRLLFALALVLALAPPSRAEDNGLVALLPFDVANATIDKATRQALEEAIRTVAGDALTPYGYTVLTGETTLSLLAENGVDAAKACEASCALQAARELKAKIFIAGTVTTSEGSQLAFIRVFESATGRQLASVQLEGEKVRDLRREFAQKAEVFFAKALGQRGAPPKAVPVQAAPVQAAPVAARPPPPEVAPPPVSDPEADRDAEPVRTPPAPDAGPGPEKSFVVSLNVLSLAMYSLAGYSSVDLEVEWALSRKFSAGLGASMVTLGDDVSPGSSDYSTVSGIGTYYLGGDGPKGLQLGVRFGRAGVDILRADGGTDTISGVSFGTHVGYQLLLGPLALGAQLGMTYVSLSTNTAEASAPSPFLAARVGYAF